MNSKSALKPLETLDTKKISQYSFTKYLNLNEPTEKKDGFQIRIYGPNTDLVTAVFNTFLNLNIDFERQYLTNIEQVCDSNYSALIPVIMDNVKNKEISIVLGYDKSTLKSVFDSFQFSSLPFSLSMIHPSVWQNRDVFAELIELREPNLYNIGVIGHQAHLSNDMVIDHNSSLGVHSQRLGEVRARLGSCEPNIRASDVFSINLDALKYSEAPNQNSPQPIGFLVEEVCQMAYYAGRSERNKVFCLWGIDKSKDDHVLGLKVINTILWYFVYGVEFRQADYPPKEERMTSFTLDTPIEGMYLAFYKDESQQKWWLKNPIEQSTLSNTHPFIACDYEDYTLAVNQQELSDRLQIYLNTYQKFELKQ
jgi:hypothetical protein